MWALIHRKLFKGGKGELAAVLLPYTLIIHALESIEAIKVPHERLWPFMILCGHVPSSLVAVVV